MKTWGDNEVMVHLTEIGSGTAQWVDLNTVNGIANFRSDGGKQEVSVVNPYKRVVGFSKDVNGSQVKWFGIRETDLQHFQGLAHTLSISRTENGAPAPVFFYRIPHGDQTVLVRRDHLREVIVQTPSRLDAFFVRLRKKELPASRVYASLNSGTQIHIPNLNIARIIATSREAYRTKPRVLDFLS